MPPVPPPSGVRRAVPFTMAPPAESQTPKPDSDNKSGMSQAVPGPSGTNKAVPFTMAPPAESQTPKPDLGNGRPTAASQPVPLPSGGAKIVPFTMAQAAQGQPAQGQPAQGQPAQGQPTTSSTDEKPTTAKLPPPPSRPKKPQDWPFIQPPPRRKPESASKTATSQAVPPTSGTNKPVPVTKAQPAGSQTPKPASASKETTAMPPPPPPSERQTAAMPAPPPSSGSAMPPPPFPSGSRVSTPLPLSGANSTPLPTTQPAQSQISKPDSATKGTTAMLPPPPPSRSKVPSPPPLSGANSTPLPTTQPAQSQTSNPDPANNTIATPSPPRPRHTAAIPPPHPLSGANLVPLPLTQALLNQAPIAHSQMNTSWVQMAQLQNALREVASDNRKLRDTAHQQQRDLNLMSDHTSEYDDVVVEYETQAQQREQQATHLQAALTRERALAAANDGYLQGLEQQCSELEMANLSMRETSFNRERAFNHHMQDMETRVQRLERELSQSSTDNQQLRWQIQKDVEDWHALRCALQATNVAEQARMEQLNHFMEKLRELLMGSDPMRQTVMAQPERPSCDMQQQGQVPMLSPLNVEMGDDWDSLCIPGGDIDMRDLTPSLESAFSNLAQLEVACGETFGEPMEGVEQLPSIYYQSMDWYDTEMREPSLSRSLGSDDSDSDNDSIVFSPPGFMKFPTRKRPRYIDDSPSDPEFEFDAVAALKRTKVCNSCGQLDVPPRVDQPAPSTGTVNVGPQQDSTSHAMSVPTAIYVESRVQMVGPCTIYSVSPKLPQHENRQKSWQEIRLQIRKPPRNYVSQGSQTNGIPFRSVQTQTETPRMKSHRVQVGKSLWSYRKKRTPEMQVSDSYQTQWSSSSPGPRVLSVNTRSMDARAELFMPGMWPAQLTPEGAASGFDGPCGVLAKELVGCCERVGHAVGVWLLQMMQQRPQDLFLSIMSLALMLYLWHCYHIHKQWISVNDMPQSVARELRERRFWESRWLDSLIYQLVNRLDVDRVAVG